MRFPGNLLLATLAVAAAAGAQDVVSGLLAQLESRNPMERSGALERIVKLPGATQNPVVSSALLSRLDAENQLNRKALRESDGQRSAGGEGYAEYCAALGDAVDGSADWAYPNTLRILAQSSYNPDSKFAARLAPYADRILPTLIEDANSDVATIRVVTLAYIAEILREYRPESLKPEGAAQLLGVLNNRATVQERDVQVRSHSDYLL